MPPHGEPNLDDAPGRAPRAPGSRQVLTLRPAPPAGHPRTGPQGETRLVQARVLSCRDGVHALRLDSGLTAQAARADGCLLAPGPGDLVLAALGPGEEAWVLTVLRKSAQDSQVLIPGRARIEAEGGRLELSAHELEIRAVRGRMAFAGLHLALGAVRVLGGQARAVFKGVEMAAGRVVQRFTDCLRRVSGQERLEAGRVAVRAREDLRLNAERAVIRAKGDVDVDGNRINLG